MFDRVFMERHGRRFAASRFLRMDERGMVFQTVFYLGRSRSDPVGYARFAADDDAMNAAAGRLLTELVDQAQTAARHL